MGPRKIRAVVFHTSISQFLLVEAARVLEQLFGAQLSPYFCRAGAQLNLGLDWRVGVRSWRPDVPSWNAPTVEKPQKSGEETGGGLNPLKWSHSFFRRESCECVSFRVLSAFFSELKPLGELLPPPIQYLIASSSRCGLSSAQVRLQSSKVD